MKLFPMRGVVQCFILNAAFKAEQIMDNSNITEPTIPPMQSIRNHQPYRCPHCGKFLFKGNIKRLNMVCHHCQKMISADAKDLIKPET